jgi:hypothetical protein
MPYKTSAFGREASQRLPLTEPLCGLSAPRTPERYVLKASLPSPALASHRERVTGAPSLESKFRKSSLLLLWLPVGMWAKQRPSPSLRRQNGGSAAFGCKPIVHISTGYSEDTRAEHQLLVTAFDADAALQARIRNDVGRRWY